MNIDHGGQVDLGELHEIEEVKIYNRSDALQFKLRDFYVFVSSQPINTQSSLENLLADENIHNYYFSGEASLQENIEILNEGRFVRIQLSGSGTLHMSEVEVMVCNTNQNNAFQAVQKNISSIDRFDDLKTIQLVPNPSSDFVAINVLSDKHISKVTVFDMKGRRILVESYESYGEGINYKQINVSKFTKGVYQVLIQLTNGQQINKKLIKQ